MRYFFLLTGFILMYVAGFSQQAKQYVFRHFSTSNGLSTNIVRNIIQDYKGYIWLATIDGLQRYDGNNFLTFKNQSFNPYSVPGDDILSVFEDKKHNFWIWADNKIGIFNTATFKFNKVLLEGDDPKNPFIIGSVCEDEQGSAIIYVYGKGLFTYNARQNKFLPTGLFQLPPEWAVIGFYKPSFGTQYTFACNKGIAVFDSKTQNINYTNHNPDNNTVVSALKDKSSAVSVFGMFTDTIWGSSWPMVGGAPFIHLYDTKTKKEETFSLNFLFGWGYSDSYRLLRQQNGRIWFYGKSFIVEYTGGKKPFRLINNEYKDEQSIKFDQVFNMYEDRDHNIWISSDNGVFLFNPDAQMFTSFNLEKPYGQQVDAPAQCALEMKDGNVLVGSWGTGLYCYDNKLNPLPLPQGLEKATAPYSIWSMHEQTKTGWIWIGSMNGLLIVYDVKTKTAKYFSNPVFHGSTIRSITEDKQGNLWFGTQRGAAIKWDARLAGDDVEKGYEIIHAGMGAYVHKMFTDNDGYVWAAVIANGLYKFDPQTNKLIDHITKECPVNHRLWSNYANDIIQYNDTLLLIAAGDLEILNTKTNIITRITAEMGLPSNTVYSMAKDKDGTIWCGLAHGLCRVNLEKKVFAVYDRRDGIVYDNFNPAGVYTFKDGRLLFPTDHNFTVFNPGNIAHVPLPPDPVITDFRLSNKPLLVDSLINLDKIQLQYDNTSVLIEFSALNYTIQNKNHYQYIMEGVDKEWQEANDFNQAVYNYLRPGNYTFKVRSENNNGIHSNYKSLHIVVMPPFWRTWWFYGMLLLLVIIILYWIDKERLKRMQALSQVRREIVVNLHQDINSTLGNISILSEMAKIKADKDVERSKEYIDQINDKSRRMIDAMDDMLWSINPENDSMEKTILRMQEFTEGLKHEKNAEIRMQVDEKIRKVKLDMKSRHEFFLIFKDALNNITEHSDHEQIMINIDVVGGKLLLKIRNSEAKLDMRCAERLEKRAELIKAELDIQPDKTANSIILIVPVG